MTTLPMRARHRDLFLMLPTQFLIYSNLFLALTLMPLYATHVGGDAFTAGVHTAIFTGSGVLMRFYFGPLADRRGRKLPLLIGSFAFATAPLLFLFTTSPGTLAMARVYQAIGLAAYLAPSSSLVADLAPPGRRGMALAANRVMITLAFTVAPTLGELAIRSLGFPSFFIGSAAAGLAGTILLLLVREPAPDADSAPITVPAAAPQAHLHPGAAADTDSGLGPYRSLLGDPRVLMGLLAFAATALTEGGVSSFLPLYMESAGGSGSGPFFVALGAGGLLAGSAGFLADRRGPYAVMVPSMVLAGVAAALLALPPGIPVLLASGLLMGVGYTAGLAAAGTLLVEAAPARHRTTAFALSETAIDTTMTLGAPTLGWVAAQLGYPWAFGVLMLVSLVAAGTMAQSARQQRAAIR